MNQTQTQAQATQPTANAPLTMPYQVLARKYRPHNFHELVGQEHVSRALINAIEQNRLHHAYLFTGTRGVGKTTIARILAKCLNCETGMTSTPCGVCGHCVAIDQGRFIDLIEIDAASRTKVEDTRELLENVPYAPTQGRYKVYLIDEVHMLSTHSFNALLKTLEEPPEHVKFLLATTDPQKLPITVISRCLQFVLRPLTESQLFGHLQHVLDKEQISHQPEALWQLAHSAHGSVRDGLSLTDQAIAFADGQLTEALVVDMLGVINATDLQALLTAIHHNDRHGVMGILMQMRQKSLDAGNVLNELSDLLHHLALLQLLPEMDLGISPQQLAKRQQLAWQIPSETLQLYYEIVNKSRESLSLAHSPTQALEMCLLRLLAFRPLGSNEAWVGHVSHHHNHEHKHNHEHEYHHEHDEHQHQYDESSDNQEHALNDGKQNDDENHGNLHDSHHANGNVPNNDDGHQHGHQQSNTSTPTIIEPVEPIESIEPIEPIEQSLTKIELTETELTAATPIKPPTEPASVSANDPRSLLQCPPADLTGQWNEKKWDYWLFLARQEERLSTDELALANQGVMTGNMQGESVFVSQTQAKNFINVFERLVGVLQQDFPNANFQLTADASLADMMQKTDEPKLPKERQKHRQNLAEQQAIKLLEQSPVMQQLKQQSGATINQIKLRAYSQSETSKRQVKDI